MIGEDVLIDDLTRFRLDEAFYSNVKAVLGGLNVELLSGVHCRIGSADKSPVSLDHIGNFWGPRAHFPTWMNSYEPHVDVRRIVGRIDSDPVGCCVPELEVSRRKVDGSVQSYTTERR